MSPNETGAEPRVLDANALGLDASRDGVFWSISSDQLHLNLVRLGPGREIVMHDNDQVDVVGVVISGESTLRLDTGDQPLHAGSVFFVPRGQRRGLAAGDQGCVYTTCHQRRPGLWPGQPPSRPVE